MASTEAMLARQLSPPFSQQSQVPYSHEVRSSSQETSSTFPSYPVSETGSESDEKSLPEGSGSELLSVGFNQDFGCFAAGTDTGFRIYNCDPFKETFRRDFSNGGIGLVEMLFRCNILAIVGGGQNPQYPPNKVMIWDDHQNRCIGELSFRSEVRGVRLRRDRICVVLEHKAYLYNFADLKLMHQMETIANPKGLCCLSTATTSNVLACPGLHRGQVRVELYDSKRTRFISAHESTLACFALTQDGARLATASNKGTLIRIFSTADGSKLQELRRGADRASIYSIAFAPAGSWLALSSDKGTVHVFALKEGQSGGDMSSEDRGEAVAAGPTVSPRVGSGRSPSGSSGGGMPGSPSGGSSLAFLKGVLPKYFSSQWSFAQFRLAEEIRCIVAFGPQKNSVIVVGSNGSYYKCLFDPATGGEMVRQEYVKFMKGQEDGES